MDVQCTCGETVALPDRHGAHSVECPKCGHTITAPRDDRSPAAAETPQGSPVPPPPPGGYPVRGQGTPLSVMVVGMVAALLVLLACGGVLMAILGPAFERARDEASRDTCARNLQLINTALSMFAAENRGLYPPLSAEPGRMIFDTEAIYPEYIGDTDVFLCRARGGRPATPSALDPHAFDDASYVYFSHALLNEEQGLLFLESVREHWAAGRPFEEDLRAAGATGLWRLRQGVEHYLAEDPLDPATGRIAQRIPVMMEWPGHHEEPGGNVLFLDGHVEFVPYPGPFPMTPVFIRELHALAGTE